MLHMSIATTRDRRSATRGRPGPASTRRHRRCDPRPARAGPGLRTGRRSRCASGRPAAHIPRWPDHASTAACRGGARRCPGARPGPGAHRVAGPPRRRTRPARPATTPRRAGLPRPGDAAVPDLGPGLLPQPPRDPAPRRDLLDALGERLLRAVFLAAFPVALDQAQRYLPGTVPDISRPGHHVLVHVPGRRPRTAGTKAGQRSPPTP